MVDDEANMGGITVDDKRVGPIAVSPPYYEEAEKGHFE